MEKGKFSRRDFLRLSALTAAGSVLAACGPAPTAEVVEVEKQVVITQEVEKIVEVPGAAGPKLIRVTANANLFIEADAFTVGQIFTVHVPEYNIAHDDVQIIVEPVARAEYTPKVLLMAASGDIPDVLWWGAATIPLWASNDVIQPVDDLADAAGFDLGAYDPNVHAVYTFDPATSTWGEGPLWALSNSFRGGLQMLWWNETVFEQAGIPLPEPDITYDELLDLAKAMTQHKGGDLADDVWGFLSFPGHGHKRLQDNALLTPFGTSIFDAEGTTAMINSPEAVTAYQWLWDLENVHMVAPTRAVEDALGHYKEMHMKSQLAMYRNGPWGGMHFRLIPPEGEEGYVKGGGMPMPPGPSGLRGINFPSGEWWAVAKASPNPMEAFDVLTYICDYQSCKYTALGALATPPLLAARQDEELMADPLIVVNIRAFELVEPAFHAKNGLDVEIDSLLANELAGFTTGEQEPTQEFLDQVAEKVQDILDKPPA